MAPPPLTTVVVINYNYARFLSDAVASVLRQSRRPHVLIVDDASTDESPEVIASLVAAHPEIESHRMPSNQGLCRVRNQAAMLAPTEWIVYLDADDWLDPHYVARGEAHLAAHPEVDVLTTDMTIVRGARQRVVRSRVPRYWNDLLPRNTIVQTSFIRRSVVLALGGYDEALDFEDWDFWIRALQAGRTIDRLPGAHVFRREHGRNKSKLCDERAATAAVRDKHRAISQPVRGGSRTAR
jgi:glycosyltransferase involved in cell wall biosynthesis